VVVGANDQECKPRPPRASIRCDATRSAASAATGTFTSDRRFVARTWGAFASPRVIARRTREHTSGRQTALWDSLDWTTPVFLTNDPFIDPADVPFEYNGRAGIEPLIAELKQAWAIGKVPSETSVANHAMFLLKLLSHNLLRRFVLQTGMPHLQIWRASWVRRVLLCIQGRLLRSGRCWSLRLPRPLRRYSA